MAELVQQSAFSKVMNLFERRSELSLEDYNREIIAHARYIHEVARRMERVKQAALHNESLRRRPLGIDNELRNAMTVLQSWEAGHRVRHDGTGSHEILDIAGLADIA